MISKDESAFRILLVEDNPGDMLLVQDYLEEEIATPHFDLAKCYEEAAALLRNPVYGPSAILLDLSLPDLKGETLIRAIMELAGTVPVIILTGYTDYSYANKAISLGAADYLIKDNLNPTTLYKTLIYSIERNKYIAELKQSEQRYANLFHLSPQPMYLYDRNTMAIMAVNRAAVVHYGYPHEQFITMKVTDLRTGSFEQPGTALASPKHLGVVESTYVHQKSDGAQILVEELMSEMNYNGKPAALVLANDVTERTKYMQAIELQNKALRDIAWTQSHLVRAPLANIMGLADLLDEEGEHGQQQQLMRHIMQSVNQLDKVIREIVAKAQQPAEGEPGQEGHG
ncbi:MAG: response regulator [Bacteroidetes bacterium]|jgi:PAS domain S-box-containing protein|nr:response regulator [Bacteroidota bacterium]